MHDFRLEIISGGVIGKAPAQLRRFFLHKNGLRARNSCYTARRNKKESL